MFDVQPDSQPSSSAARETFSARCCVHGQDLVIHVAGELDLASRGQMIEACLQGDSDSAVVDLADLTFMDCAGFGAIVATRSILAERGGVLRLANASGEPGRFLALMGEALVWDRAFAHLLGPAPCATMIRRMKG